MTQNNANNVTDNKTDTSKITTHTFTSDQYQRLMSLLSGRGDASKAHASVADVSQLNLTVVHPNGTIAQVKQIGSFKFGNNLILKDVLVVPGYHDLTQRFLMRTGSERGCLYFLDEGKRVNNSNIRSCIMPNCIWHNRLGHPSDQVLTVLKHKLKDLKSTSSEPCEICHKAKQTREPFPLNDHKTKNMGDLVHLDVWGPYMVTSRYGFKYFLTVVDDYTRAVWVFLMKNKSGQNNHQAWRIWRNPQKGSARVPRGFRQVFPFKNSSFTKDFVFEENGINDLNFFDQENESSQNNLRPDEPNDDKKSSIDSNTKSIPETSTHKPSVITIDEVISVDEHLHAETTDTTDTTDVDINLPVEIADTADTTNVDNTSDTSSRKDTESSEYATETTVSDGMQSTNHVDDEYNSEGEELDMFGKMFETPEPAGAQTVRRTSRMTTLPSKYKDYVLNKNLKYGIDKVVKYSNLSFDNFGFTVSLNKIHEATTYEEAVKDSRKTIGYKWVFKVKYKANGEVERFKARLVAKGFNQKEVEIADTADTANVDNTSDTSSRKDTESSEYATETTVSDGMQSTNHVDDEYNSEGEELDMFGKMFETLEPAGAQTVRRTSRMTALPSKYKDYVLNKNLKYGIDKVVKYSNLSFDNFGFTVSLNKIHEATTYEEAVKDSRWVEAMNLEIETLNRNGTWEVVELPAGRKTIGYKWVFKVKYTANGEVERFKARLVAKGFNQKEGIDDEETFSPVVKIVTVRCVLSIAVNNKWPIFQLDVNNAFLYGELEEDVYMLLPEGFSDKNDKRVCKLVKSLYGLKQAPRNGMKSIEVLDVENGICLTQRKYCSELLTEFGMLGCRPCGTPIETNPDNTKLVSKFGDDELLTGVTNYQKLVGKLIYLTLTRPDISYVVHCLSQVMHKPMKSHLRLAFRVLRYLKKELGLGITFRESDSTSLKVFVNSDWAKCKITKILVDLHVNVKLPVEMLCDNSSAMQISVNLVLHERSKHFEIDLYFLREIVADGFIKPVKVKLEYNVADLFTKGLNISNHKNFASVLVCIMCFMTILVNKIKMMGESQEAKAYGGVLEE
ncbi:hypothetical protein CTI12_AA274590 [Artemisia annua]|uniref:Uncharacterized protein n=1 Tax=Artemisia annua TaxID=35608 RepID=A0A2U1NEU7_ARTAN|nr:hypothetical protein CTI12_AA274590 [Artemisia annua]